MSAAETELDRRAGLWLGLWGLLALCCAVFALSRPGAGAQGHGHGGRGHGPGSGADGQPLSPGASIDGRVHIELHPKVEGKGASPVLDPDDPDPVEGEASPYELAAPGDGTCTALAWQEGRRVSERVSCKADGSYALLLRPGVVGKVAVEIEVPGRLRAVLETEVESGEQYNLPDVALGLGFGIRGQVVDARGDPIPSVEVQARPNPDLEEPEPWRATSDAQGDFAFETLPVGAVDLQAVLPGYALSVVEAYSPEEGVLIVLRPLIDLEGAVVAPEEVYARAKVRLEGSSVWPPIEKDIASDGSFSFEQLPDGVYGVEVIATSPRPEDGELREPEYASVPLVNITPDLRVSVAMVPAFRVPVRVEDPEGQPIPGARVTVGYASVGLLQRMVETDIEGRASAGPVVPGDYLLRADATGYLGSGSVEVRVDAETAKAAAEDPSKEQVIVLARPGQIEGKVVDPTGRPVADAYVVVEAEGLYVAGEHDARAQMFGLAMKGGTGSLGVTQGKVPDIPKLGEEELGLEGVLSDAEGRFFLEDLVPGTYRLRAIHGQHAGSSLVKVDVGSGEQVKGVELVLREGALVTGVVRGSNGQPVLDASLELPDGQLISVDELGTFDAGFHAGRQEIIVRAPGYVPQRVPMDLGTGKAGAPLVPKDLEVVLEVADATIRAVVRDGNGQPIKGAWVTVRMLDDLTPTELVETDSSGAFEVSAMPGGKVEIEIDHLDYVQVGRSMILELGKTSELELSMEMGWTIPILVREVGSGDPLAGVQLIIGTQVMYTDKKGRASLRKLQGKEVEIEVVAAGWSPGHTTVKRPAVGAQSDEVLVELERGGSIEGTLTDETGAALVGTEITLEDEAGELLTSTRTRKGGAWRIDGAPEGAVVLRVKPPADLAELLAPIREQSDVRRGEVTRDVQLRFDRL